MFNIKKYTEINDFLKKTSNPAKIVAISKNHPLNRVLEAVNAGVYIFDIETGKQEIVGEFPGMTFAPRFSPKGDMIVMSYTDPEVGNSEIYLLDLNTRISKRITNNSAIDVSASFSPDGKKIVFNSDRSGRRHLYITDINSKNVKSISGNIEKINLGENKFDIIFLAGIYQHLQNPAFCLSKFINSLKTNGKMYMGFYRSGEFKYFIVDAIRHIFYSFLSSAFLNSTTCLLL